MSDELHETTSEALRKLGRDDLADNLDAGVTHEPAVDENEAFVRELREAVGRNSVSIPGLLDQ